MSVAPTSFLMVLSDKSKETIENTKKQSQRNNRKNQYPVSSSLGGGKITVSLIQSSIVETVAVSGTF